MSLYTKYRPKDFEDVVGQDFIKTSLKNALKMGKIHHGYIFYGSHGIGKTTLARIFAKAINCTNLSESGNPCHECENCRSFDAGKMVDVIEIDAASNTGVDNIRDLIEKAQFQPNQGKYKVYVIDEVHMLSKGAFNALLKTLEEPPEHVIFILATTEIHKVPDTILSRTLRWDLKKFSVDDIVGRLEYIAKSEKVDAEKDGLKLLAQSAKGGMRDAIGLFEQYVEGGKITAQMVMDNLQMVDDTFLDTFFGALQSQDVSATNEALEVVADKGVDTKVFLDQALTYLHEKAKEHLGTAHFDWYQNTFHTFHESYLKLKFSPDPKMYFEVMIQGLLHKEGNTASIETSAPKPEPAVKKEGKKVEVEEVQEEEEEDSSSQAPQNDDKQDFSIAEFVRKLQESDAPSSIISLIKGAKIESSNEKIVFHLNSFGIQKLKEAASMTLLQRVLMEAFGFEGKVEFVEVDIVAEAQDVFN